MENTPPKLIVKSEPIIGLEVHVELKTKSKMFCSCPAEHFGASPNTQTCPVCLGMPGALPYANQQAVEWTILLGLALNCQISHSSKFDRKNYFYPDLPKGYQISQYDRPLAVGGVWDYEKGQKVRIRRVHLEEDTGKLIHQGQETLIDFNRSGVPLVEIVTEPDFNSGQQVKLYLQRLQELIRTLGIANADMEKGEMRCEPNINLKIEIDGKIIYTPIVEIKNINSFRFVQQAIDYECQRQRDLYLETGLEKQTGNKQTRGWNENRKVTFPQREKEEAEDYRYFPEPDIPPLRWTDEQVSGFKLRVASLEMPGQKVSRLIKDYGLDEYKAKVLVENPVKEDYFREACGISPRLVSTATIANYIINNKIDINQINPEDLPKLIAEKEKAVTMSEEEIEKMVMEVMKENPEIVKQYQEGKITVLEYLVGQVMKKTKGKGNPQTIRQIFTLELGVDK